jgi:AraC family transcriptional regulator
LVGPEFKYLHEANIVLRARARRHSAEVMSGPFSVKGVLDGEVSWEVGEQRFRVSSGSYLVLDRGESYRLNIDEYRPVETFVVFFADDFVADLAAARLETIEQLLDHPDAASWLPITRRLWEGATRLNAGMRVLRSILGSAPEQGELELALRGLLDGCADLAAQTRREQDRLAATRASTRAEVHRRLLRGKALLDDRFDAPFDLSAAAREACLSAHHFHRSFRAVFGAAPYAYVAARRISKALRLLRETDMPIAEVCSEVGYESLPSFTARFRRETGDSPAACREKVRKDR